MKKLLALVLALVMTLGLATVGTNAALSDFSDASDVTNEEAMAVMNAVGVFVGSDGKLDPKGSLTRAAAAKLVAYLALGEDIAEALPKTGSKFADVPDGAWYTGYVSYMVNEGYTSGTGANTFSPNATLTGYQFGAFLLAVLGYDRNLEGMVGSGWETKVAVKLEELGINKNVDKLGSAALTREEAAQFCLNALKADTVKYDDKGTSIDINGAKITTGAKAATAVTTATKGNNDAIKDEGRAPYVVQLGEKLYKGDLTFKAVANGDDFKREAKEWSYKNDDVFTVPTEADYSFVATKTYTTVKAANGDDNKAAALKAQINDQLGITKDSSKLAFVTGDTVYTNGRDSAWTDIQLGDVVEIYTAANDDKNITSVVITRYTTNKITKVDTSLTKAQKDDGATCKITVDGNVYLDTKVEGFNAATFVKDAYIMYVVKNNAKEIIATAFPTSVEGKVTATKGSTAQIGGTYYEKNGKAVNVGDKGTFYLGKANEIVAVDATESKSENYAYIYNVTLGDKTNSDGVKSETATIYYIGVDGVKASADAKKIEHAQISTGDALTALNAYLGINTIENGDEVYYLDDGANGVTKENVIGYKDNNNANAFVACNSVMAFSINSDGKFVRETAKDTINKAVVAKTTKTNPVVGNGKVADDSTKFIFVYKDNNNAVKTRLATGYKTVDLNNSNNGQTVYSVSKSNKADALYVFVAADNAYTTDANLAVLLDATPAVGEDADGDPIYTYAVAINGEVTDLTFETELNNSYYDGAVFSYKMGTTYAEVDTGLLTKDTVTAKGTDYFTVTSNQTSLYRSTTNAKIYTITVEFKNTTESAAYKQTPTSQAAEGVTVSEGATFDKGDWVYYTLKSGSQTEVKEVYVVEFVD